MVARIANTVGAILFAGIIVMLVVQQRQVSELAAAVSTLTRGGSASNADLPPTAGAGSSEVPVALATRVARLEARIEQLQSPEPSSGQEKTVPTRKVDTAAEEEGERTALTQNTLRTVLQSDPGVRDQLRTAVREEQDRLDEESRSRRETDLAESRRADLEELAKKVHLSTVQVELLYDLLGTEREKMLQVFRQVREDGLSMADARAQVEVIRKATDKEAAAELDDDQFSGFQEMRPVYRVGGRPPGRR